MATDTSRERLAQTVEQLPEPVIEVDAQGLFLFANRAALDCFRLGSVAGVQALDLVAPVDRARAEVDLRRLLSGERLGPTDYFARRSDGSTFPARVHCAPIERDGRTVGVRGILLDLGRTLSAEEQLHTLITAMPDIVCFKDGQGRWLEANEFDLELFGLRGKEWRGRTDRELAEVSPFHRASFLECVVTDEAAWQTRATARGEETIPRPDGSALVFDIIKAPLFHPDGSRRALVVIGREITERKRLEARYLQAQKMEAVGRLAGSIAHDFNNLLTVITGFAALASQATAEAATRESLAEVLGAAGSAAELTRQLLAFSRRQVVLPRVVSLGALVSGMEGMLRRLVGEQVRVEVHPGAAAGADPVRVDPGQFEQVVMNLVVNARDAMPSGGVLTLATRAVSLDAAEAGRHEIRSGEYLELSVADTGVGMDEAVHARLFEPFFTTKPKGEGTGLGLATAYGIVRQAGGLIRVETAPGKGTTFRVLLPRADAPAQPLPDRASAGAPPREAPRAGATVLVVEDDASLQHLAREILGKAGYLVLAAGTLREALAVEKAHQGGLDVLLTDLVLPDGSGREVARALGERRSGLRVLYTSGYADQALIQDLERGGEMGPRYLPKPFAPADLLARVRALLDRPR